MAGHLGDEALRLGARLSSNGKVPEATSLLRVEAIFDKWLLFKDQKALRAVLSAVAAHLAGGEGPAAVNGAQRYHLSANGC